ncbi:RNA methyltransferase [Pseudomethylobacillus aquaticus]|uniref:RNA methyltransferase n=1 Tax=Pseudomethylobacillus aquaticus TaxID=2676064 RepID=A0A3N0V5V1_9PROT|nr:RNA methyltransferase [Pseudomethylobacillus aquaticus]ROH88166.1 RNA methyltransferase [Pseudomethylobacillus aquaticus]
MKQITSRDNPQFKQLKKLVEQPRARREQDRILLDGAHLIDAYVAEGGVPDLLIVADGACSEDAQHTLNANPAVEQLHLPPGLFAELSPVATPTGILALAVTPRLPVPAEPVFALLLEDIQDPGNLGAILRSAAAAGVDAVYLSAACADVWSAKVLRGGQGAHFLLPLLERADLCALATAFNGQVLATSPHGAALYTLDLRQPSAFLVGNEGKGLSPALMACASVKVSIPMPGRIESLNAAAATAICLFERVRQQAR